MRRLLPPTFLALMLVTVSLLVSACTGDPVKSAQPAVDDTVGAPVPPSGGLLAEADGVFAVYAGSSTADASQITATRAPERAAPEGVAALGQGVTVELTSPLDGPVQVRLPLPDRPTPESVPGILHVADDGGLSVIPALWDEPAGEVVVWTDSFSSNYAAFFDPRTWAEGGAQVRGALAYVGNWLTGRTTPPACGPAPSWARMSTRELSSVHSCLQVNRENGVDRAEILLKSNRQTWQMITIPSTTKDYLWLETGQDVWTTALTSALGGDPNTTALLTGGDSMSMGFPQPRITTEGEIRSFQTHPLVLVNPVAGLLGGLIDMSAQGRETTLALVYATLACVDKIGGTDFHRGDIVPAAAPNVVQLRDGVECVVGLLSNPKYAASLVAEAIRTGGIDNVPAGFESRVATILDRLKPAAKAAGTALAGVGVVTTAWDGIFDNLAEGSLTYRLEGVPAEPTRQADPASYRNAEPPQAGYFFVSPSGRFRCAIMDTEPLPTCVNALVSAVRRVVTPNG